MDHKTILIIIAILLIIIVFANMMINDSKACTTKTIKEGFDQCYNQSPTSTQIAAMGTTAEEACNRISSKAEEIKAKYDGTSGIINSALGALSPNNYKSGDNSSSDMMRNIVNMNLSSCDITKISNDCVNSSASLQSNEIDNTKCEYCKINLCTAENIDQSNIMNLSQSCTMQSAIETLLKKTSSIDCQALAQVLQEAQGLLSGNNTTQKENCNVINNDLSTANYLENKASCANIISLNQNNSVKFCGLTTGIVQKNQFDALNKCLIGTSLNSTSDTTGTVVVTHENESEQTTTGVTPLSSMSSMTSSCILCIVLLAISFFGSQEYTKHKNSQQKSS